MTPTTATDLEYTQEVQEATDHIYPKLKDSIPEFEWRLKAPLIARINQLKQEQGVVILGHNYQVPEIFHGVADFKGDSLGLSKKAQEVQEDTILFCGVHFMAETAKILNPDKTVLIPDLEAGCSLSESITRQDVQLLKERYPGVPVVSYANTPAAIKAESDFCCTSANARAVVEAAARRADTERVIFLPDQFLAENVAQKTDVKILTWHGKCIVHEQFSADQIQAYRDQYPGIEVLAHPECSPEVCEESDYVGSTSGMIGHLDQVQSQRVIMITECSMSDNVQEAHPNLDLIKPCTLCPHMKKITLEKTLRSLQKGIFEVEVEEKTRIDARKSLDRMLSVGRQED